MPDALWEIAEPVIVQPDPLCLWAMRLGNGTAAQWCSARVGADRSFGVVGVSVRRLRLGGPGYLILDNKAGPGVDGCARATDIGNDSEVVAPQPVI